MQNNIQPPDVPLPKFLEQKKELFIKILRKTERSGIENVLNWLEKTDFYTAPASARFHGCFEGGLLLHSLNVYDVLRSINDGIVNSGYVEGYHGLPFETIAIAALLHDVCKVNFYTKIKRWRKDENQRWEQYDTWGYEEQEPLGHGEKSVIILQRLGLYLSSREIYMIRWHMGGFDENAKNCGSAMNKYPSIALMHAADLIATNLLEQEMPTELAEELKNANN